MDDRGETEAATTDHADAAAEFADRACARFPDEIEELYVFGSTVRGEASGLASDVDVLVALDDEVDSGAVADELRDIAYDVMLAHGPVVELHLLTKREFERYRESGNPFLRNVVNEGRSYA